MVMCSAPWYWKTRRTSRRPAHHQQVAHEEHHADERLGEALEDGLVAAPGRRHARLGQEERQQDEDADGDGEGHAAA